MAQHRLSRLQFHIMEIFWERGGLSVREVHEAMPPPRPAYSTIQTLVTRVRSEGALKRTRKIGNAHILEAVLSRDAVQHRVLDEFLALFGGRPKLLMARLAESGKLTLEDVQDAEKYLRSLVKKEGRKK